MTVEYRGLIWKRNILLQLVPDFASGQITDRKKTFRIGPNGQKVTIWDRSGESEITVDPGKDPDMEEPITENLFNHLFKQGIWTYNLSEPDQSVEAFTVDTKVSTTQPIGNLKVTRL